MTIKPGNIFLKKDILVTKKNFFFLRNFIVKEFKIREVLTKTIDKNNRGNINVDILLTPLKKYEIQLYFEIFFSKKNNINISSGAIFLIRNIFKKGENIFFSIKKNINSNKKIFKLKSILYLPCFFPQLSFFSIKENNLRSKIDIELNINNNKNILFYNKLEYIWNTNYYNKHTINIFNIFKYYINKTKNDYLHNLCIKLGIEKKHINNDYIYYNRINKAIKDQLFNNIYSKLLYKYNYNQIINKNNKYPTFFYTKIEIIGNIFSLFENFILKEKNIDLNFFKIDVELKKYFFLKKKQLLTSRFFVGIEIPYNSYNKILLNKKYFFNGKKDIRAWYLYSLGPGILKKKSIYSSFSDIKILFNIEYRFKIISDTYFSFFIDAGNTWILPQYNSIDKRGLFYFKNFYEQIALGGGLGLRYDLKYMIVRIDLAHKIIDPIKKYLNKSILHNNIINFAIGYPF